MKIPNDIELEQHHRAIRRLEGDLDRLLRESDKSLEEVYWTISREALEARRRLRKLCASR